VNRLLVLLLLLAAPPVVAAPGRFALVVGDNRGDRGETVLRYAESDARRIAEVLRGVGDFFPENVTLLTGVHGDDVRRALIALNARLRAREDRALLFVFYSGHADADALHLDGTRFGLAELRELVAGSPAEARVLIVDSCRSGALTRVKGGRPAPPFRIDAAAPGAEGLAILTSSAAGEDAQESDQLGASVFTHHLLSALLGAADRDGDGRIGIDEAFGYAAERTLASTAATFIGPQHPTYHLELSGRSDLVLTTPGGRVENRGALVFADPGTYLVQRSGPRGPVVAELAAADRGGRLSVEGGDCFVSERRRDHLRQGRFQVAAGAVTQVSPADMRRVEYAEVVRKGQSERRHALSLFALGGVRGELLGLGTAWRTDVGLRLDLRAISLDLRLGLGGAERLNQRLFIQSWEVAGSVAGSHVFDFGRAALGLGLELGLAWLGQRFDRSDTAPRDVLAGFLAPIASVEMRLARRLYARADGAFVTYFVPGEDAVAALLGYRFGAGLGVYF
jgi:hypothetical protein